MIYIPAKVEQRIKSNITRYKRILKTAKDKDIKEANTVTYVVDMLEKIMGWDKFSEITREYETQGQYCDIGIKIDEKPYILIEVKAIGIKLNERHLKQAVSYALTSDTDWVVLTNGIDWMLYKVLNVKPTKIEQVFSLNFLEINSKDHKAIEQIFSLCKESLTKSILSQVLEETQVTNRFVIASLIQAEPVLNVIKREIKKMSKSVKVEDNMLLETLRNGVLKIDVIEGENSDNASKLIKQRMRKFNKEKEKKLNNKQ